MKSKLLLVIMLALAVIAPCAHAVMYNLGNSGWAMVVDNSVQTVGKVSVPYIFGIAGDAVVIEIDKSFERGPSQYGFFDPIVIEFLKVSRTSINKIVINDEYIVNNTGYEWDGFKMSLQVTQAKEAGFVPGYVSGGQLEHVWYDGVPGFNNLPTSLNFMNAIGDGVKSAPAGNDVFRPGYLAGDIVIAANPNLEIGSRFLLKEVPTMVPEPTTIALFVFGIIPAIIKKKRNV